MFMQCSKIENSLKSGSIQDCLAWCSENKTTLKKMNVSVSEVVVAFNRSNIWNRVISNTNCGYNNTLN